jgi:hypothetical protein
MRFKKYLTEKWIHSFKERGTFGNKNINVTDYLEDFKERFGL